MIGIHFRTLILFSDIFSMFAFLGFFFILNQIWISFICTLIVRSNIATLLIIYFNSKVVEIT
jgi:hypothetical protein